MSIHDTAETLVDRRHAAGAAADHLDHVLPAVIRDGEGYSLTVDGDTVKINMHHRPMGGEVQGMRETIGRHTAQLVAAGNDPSYALQVALGCASRMERRLERGPKSR